MAESLNTALRVVTSMIGVARPVNEPIGVAIAMIAAACGGGGATPSVGSTNPAARTKGNVVSPDGMLTVIPLAGAGDITIAGAASVKDFGQ